MSLFSLNELRHATDLIIYYSYQIVVEVVIRNVSAQTDYFHCFVVES
jgi:hypothetical protein